MKKSKMTLIFGIISLVISIVLTIGVKTVFHACGLHDDGSYGSCHWAEQAVLAAGIILILESLILTIAQDSKAGAAVSACITGTAIVTALIPNVFINLCMMPSMHCNAVMRPAVLVCCVLLAILGIVSMCLNLKNNRRTRIS